MGEPDLTTNDKILPMKKNPSFWWFDSGLCVGMKYPPGNCWLTDAKKKRMGKVSERGQQFDPDLFY